MAKAARTSSWRGWLPDISTAIERFPAGRRLRRALHALQALSRLQYGDPKLRTLGALAACFLWVVAVDLFVESTRRTRAARFVLSAAGILVIALLFWLRLVHLARPQASHRRALCFSSALPASLAATRATHRSGCSISGWCWARGVALVGACLFGAGLSSIVETLNTLFALDLPARWHEHIWTVSLGLIAPVSALPSRRRSFERHHHRTGPEASLSAQPPSPW